MSKPPSGYYTRGDHEIRFTSNPNEYESYYWGEWGLREYSRGSWALNGDKLSLSGFNDTNLKILAVESSIQSTAGNGTRINIDHTTDKVDHGVRTMVIVNGDKVYPITKDTSFTPDVMVNTIQVRTTVFCI